MNFIKKISGVLVVLTIMIPGIGFASDSENNKNNLLFKIERNRDADEIYYELNPDETGRPDKKEPVKVYWVKHTQNGKTEPLTWIQKNIPTVLKRLIRKKRESMKHKKKMFVFGLFHSENVFSV